MSRPDQLSRRVRLAAVFAGLAAAGCGCVALAGLLLTRPALATLVRGQSSLAPAGAAAFVLIGAGGVLVAPAWRGAWVRRAALGPALGAFMVGLALLWEQALGTDLLFTGPLAVFQALARGRVPAMTAGALTLVATALGLMALGGRRRLLVGQALSLLTLGVACIGLTGQIYGIDALLLGGSPFAGVSLVGLVGLLAAALGLLLARPEVGALHLVIDPTAGGVSFRRLLPPTVLLVLTLGALRVWGEARGFYPGALGSAIFAVTTVFLIGGLIVWNALALRDAEQSLRAEQETRDERQRQFRHAIVEAPIPILMFADDGEVLQVSRTVEEVTGYPMDDIVDLASWNRLTSGDGEQAARRSLLAALDEFREVEIRTRDGMRRIWRVRTSSLGRLSDDREAYVAMATDLTKIRRAEEQKDEFLAVLGHELRNPLAALSTGLELQRHGDDAARRAVLADMMRRQVRHLGRLLDDLLDVSRISRGKITLRLDVVSLNEAAERVVEEHRADGAPEGGPRITLMMPPRPIHVSADPTRLHQILDNLVGNAVKYTPEDGRVWVSVEREVEEAVVRVRDSGVGMDQHEIETVFEPFRQLGHAQERQRGGLGLGLTLVRQLAGLHGGSVTGASRGRGQGSTFVLRLPVTVEPPEVAPDEEPKGRATEAEEAAPRLRLLVVDDQREVADGFAELLSLHGHEATTAYDGASAIELAERTRPHAVFLDLDLPDFDGRTVARRLRERLAEPPTLIAVSGFGGDRHFELSRAAGIDRHLVKPVDIDRVLELLREVPVGA